MFGGPGGAGGFFNMGAPEVVVIGAVAWVLLGPKELFRLSREAGQFLGQWQQLGQQAKDSFTSALEAEIAEDEMAKVPDPPSPLNVPPPAPPAAPSAAAAATSGVDSLPPLADFTAARAASEAMTAEEKDALRESMIEEMGDPATSAANFQEQISGARNENVLSEYPADLEMPPTPTPMDGSPLDVQGAEEDLLQTQIDQTENDLATLRTEKQLLALKRKQLQANAERAERMAEERVREAEKAVANAEEAAQPQSEA